MAAPNFALRAWIAFDAPTSTSPTWVEITGFVEQESPITINHGRSDGLSDVNASTCALTVDNSDGRFSAANPAGTWYGQIHKGNWLKVEITPPSATVSSRFVGFITSLPTQWSGQYAYGQITASDRFEKLGQAPALISTIEHEVLSDPNIVGSGSMQGYWNLHEGQNSLTFGDTSGLGARHLVATGYGGVPAGIGFGASNVNGPGFDGLRAVTFNPVSQNVGTYLTAPVASPTPGTFNLSTGAYTGLYPTLEFWFQMPIVVSAGNPQAIAGFYDMTTSFGVTAVVSTHRLLFSVEGTNYANAAGYSLDFQPYPFAVDDGQWHHVIVGVAATNSSGGWASMVAIVDGVWARTSVQAGGSFGMTSMAFNQLTIGGGYNGGAAPGIVFFGQVNMAEVAWYWSDLWNLTAGAGRPPDALTHYQAGLTGFTGETTDQRVARLARYAGLSESTTLVTTSYNAVPPFSPTTLGKVQRYQQVTTPWVNLSPGAHQVATQSISGRKAPDVMREAARTEGTPLFIDRSGYLTLQASTVRQNTSPAWSVDALDVDPQTAVADDYTYTTNQITVTPNSQAAQTVVGAVGLASQAKHGEYDGSQATASLNPVEAQSLGLSIIQLRADPGPRIAPLVIEASTLALLPGYGSAWYDAVLATEISTPVRVTNAPAALGGNNYDVLIEGWTETITAGSHMIAFNVSPIQGPTYQLDDTVLGHIDTDGSTLSGSTLNTTALTFQVATGAGFPLWTRAGADFPFDIRIDGEQITISGISGTSSPQTFTASARSVNGVAASHSVGAVVSLWQPLTLAY